MKNGKVQEIAKPHMISEYTKYMGGIDLADQYCSSYAFLQKTLKWWRKLYFFILEMSITNSFILYNLHMKATNKKQLRHRLYREQLSKELVGEIRNPNFGKRRKVNPIAQEARLDGLFHGIDQMPNNRKRDCLVCSDRKRPGGRKETTYYCITCPSQPPLHPKYSFTAYHTKRDYKIKYT